MRHTCPHVVPHLQARVIHPQPHVSGVLVGPEHVVYVEDDGFSQRLVADGVFGGLGGQMNVGERHQGRDIGRLEGTEQLRFGRNKEV